MGHVAEIELADHVVNSQFLYLLGDLIADRVRVADNVRARFHRQFHIVHHQAGEGWALDIVLPPKFGQAVVLFPVGGPGDAHGILMVLAHDHMPGHADGRPALEIIRGDVVGAVGGEVFLVGGDTGFG